MIKAISTATSGLLNARKTINENAATLAGADTAPRGDQARTARQPGGNARLEASALSSADMLEAAVTIKQAEHSFRANANVLRTTYELSQARINAFDDKS
jgi:flagellar basal body rod protein FlgC